MEVCACEFHQFEAELLFIIEPTTPAELRFHALISIAPLDPAFAPPVKI